MGAACGGSSTGDESETGGTSGEGGSGGAGTAGTGTAGRGGGTSGAGGSAGTAGSSAGSGGTPAECIGHGEAASCAPIVATLPRKCVTAAQAVPETPLPSEKCKDFCNGSNAPCSVSAVDGTTITVLCQPGCAIGRRPAGLEESAGCDHRAIGDYFAEVARLEGASITAFRILRDELRASGAPKKLVRAAARAARDEMRHTRSTSALARRFGGTPRQPRMERAQPRSLEAMAIENAVEGCVRETYGALLATRQATLARDPVVRATMVRIARDETQHAALSWRVARFLSTRLDARAQRNVKSAKEAAARELLGSLQSEPALPFAELAGLPSPAEAVRLASAMNHALWS